MLDIVGLQETECRCQAKVIAFFVSAFYQKKEAPISTEPLITSLGRLLSFEPDSSSAKAAKTQSLKWVWVPAKGEALSAPPHTPVSGL
jgi:hypothetical protein